MTRFFAACVLLGAPPSAHGPPVTRLATPLLAERTGFAPHYKPGVIEAVARNRGIPASACMIAAYAFAIGSWVVVRSHRNGRKEKCRVVDTCAPEDCRRLRARGYVAELGWPAAVRLCDH